MPPKAFYDSQFLLCLGLDSMPTPLNLISVTLSCLPINLLIIITIIPILY